MHGAARGSGASAGERNGAWKHGLYTQENMALSEAPAWLRLMRSVIKSDDVAQ